MKKGELLRKFGRLYTEELGINVKGGKDDEIFRWFLASVLYGAPIGEKAATKTYRIFISEGVDSPRKILETGWDRLVTLLDNGGYTRYDFKTANKLLEMSRDLLEKYNGSLNLLYQQSKNQAELEANIKSLAKGIGDVTVQIFLREMHGVWKEEPKHSELAKLAAKRLGIRFGKRFDPRLEVALMRVGRMLRRGASLR